MNQALYAHMNNKRKMKKKKRCTKSYVAKYWCWIAFLEWLHQYIILPAVLVPKGNSPILGII
jgi:hypothetical protein